MQKQEGEEEKEEEEAIGLLKRTFTATLDGLKEVLQLGGAFPKKVPCFGRA